MICSRCHCPITRQIDYTWIRGLIVCRTCWEIESHDIFTSGLYGTPYDTRIPDGGEEE